MCCCKFQKCVDPVLFSVLQQPAQRMDTQNSPAFTCQQSRQRQSATALPGQTAPPTRQQQTLSCRITRVGSCTCLQSASLTATLLHHYTRERCSQSVSSVAACLFCSRTVCLHSVAPVPHTTHTTNHPTQSTNRSLTAAAPATASSPPTAALLMAPILTPLPSSTPVAAPATAT